MINAIADGMSNSLSPEPCALSPAELRLHANLTVGAPDAPAISRPDVLDVGMPIEHLDFEPPCEAERPHTHAIGAVPATWIHRYSGCAHIKNLSLLCDSCHGWYYTNRVACAVCLTSVVVTWEPLR